jgi:hypothetical protein
MPDQTNKGPTELPEHLLEVIAKMPSKIDRPAGAQLVTENAFQVAPASVKSWPLPWEYPNERASAPPASYLQHAHRKACNAPRAIGFGRRLPRSLRIPKQSGQ